MYEKFFNLKEKPFELTPDPKFLFLTKEVREIISSLIYGVSERRGLLALIGEVGCGKTLMLNAMLSKLNQQSKFAFISNSDLTFKQLLITFLYNIGAIGKEEYISKEKALIVLNDFAINQLENKINLILIVDEAQNIGSRTMENLRMLSNIETVQYKLIQIVLSGQPELDEKLNKPNWRQLVQRISLKRYAVNLNEKDTYDYIKHRLSVAGNNGTPIFSNGALQKIWEYTFGNPRKINVLCDNSLLIGYGIEEKVISSKIVKEVIQDFKNLFIDKKYDFRNAF